MRPARSPKKPKETIECSLDVTWAFPYLGLDCRYQSLGLGLWSFGFRGLGISGVTKKGGLRFQVRRTEPMFGFRVRGGTGTRFLVSWLYPQARRDSTRLRKERHRRLWVSFLTTSLTINFNKQVSSIMGVN